ncbi:unnamed protein product [Fusarium graminearum]|nr:unnamed protein product [Fusarium graminearum]
MARKPITVSFQSLYSSQNGTHILNIMQWRSKFWEVSAQNILHGVLLHPIHTLARVNFRTPTIASDESIRLDATSGHEDEDAEGRVTETETLGEGFTEGTDEKINSLKIAFVDFFQLGCQFGVTASEVNEALRGRHVE